MTNKPTLFAPNLNTLAKTFGALSIFTSLSAQARNQNYKLDTSVVSASGFAQDIKEAPASISIISKEELSSKPYRDIAEAIADIPGVDLYASKDRSGAYNLTLRGITGYTLILIDGRRTGVSGEVLPDQYQGVSNTFIPPLSSIERIEVIKGPASTLYGSEALGGVINIITKKVSDKWGFAIGGESIINEWTDWGNLYSMNLSTSGPLIKDKLGLMLRFKQTFREDSQVNYANGGRQIPAGRSQSPVEASFYNIGTRLNYNINAQNTIIVDLDYAKNSYDNSKGQLGTGSLPIPNTPPGSVIPGSRTGGYERKLNIAHFSSLIAHEGNYANATINSGLQYNRLANDGRLVGGTPQNPNLGQNRQLISQDYILDSKIVFPLGQSHVLSLGGEYKKEKFHDKILIPSKLHSYAIALFGEDEYSIIENLNLTLGARFNHHQNRSNNISPRAYLVYNPTEQFTIKGGVATGFKAPFIHLSHKGPISYANRGRYPVYGNPNIKEETSINYEISSIYQTPLFFASITGFITNFHDKIGRTLYLNGQQIPSIGLCTTTECRQEINRGKVEIKGLELATGITPTHNTKLDLFYTYTKNKVKESISQIEIGKPEDGSLTHNIGAKLGLSFDSFSPYIKAQYQAGRYRAPSLYDQLGNQYKNVFLLSLGGTWQINKNYQASAGVFNLLDKNYANSFVYANNQYYNRYNRVEERRRYWLALTGTF